MNPRTHVAFLRGMNLGGRRITNDELCAAFEAIGFEGASAYQAAGNVIFVAPGRAGRRTIEQRIEKGLREQLDYEVPTIVRSAAEVIAIAECSPFRTDRGADGGKPQVVLLQSEPNAAAAKRVLTLSCDDDQLALHATELHWLPRAGLTDSELDITLIERTIGPTTTRTKGTIERLAARLSQG